MRARRARREAEGWAETQGAEGGHRPQLSCRQLCSSLTLSPDVQELLHPPSSLGNLSPDIHGWQNVSTKGELQSSPGQWGLAHLAL